MTILEHIYSPEKVRSRFVEMLIQNFYNNIYYSILSYSPSYKQIPFKVNAKIENQYRI